MYVELIGEEIYDEFDPQGHPDLKSFAQNESKPPHPILERKGSALELVGGITRTASTKESPRRFSANAPNKAALSALKLNFKGLGFTRSRSAPPSPTEEKPEVFLGKGSKDKDISVTVQESAVDDEKYDYFPRELHPDHEQAEMDFADVAPVHTSTDEAPQIVAPQPLSPAANVSSSIHAPTPVAASALPSNHRIVNPALILPYARNPSPSPSLEQAILVERKRRAAAGMSSAVVPKGTRFKSSPLTGDRGGGVVAERVKRTTVTSALTDEQLYVSDDGHNAEMEWRGTGRDE